jgi:hypothetical protein
MRYHSDWLQDCPLCAASEYKLSIPRAEIGGAALLTVVAQTAVQINAGLYTTSLAIQLTESRDGRARKHEIAAGIGGPRFLGTIGRSMYIWHKDEGKCLVFLVLHSTGGSVV